MKRGSSNNIDEYAPEVKCDKKIPIKYISSEKKFNEVCTTPITELTKIRVDIRSFETLHVNNYFPIKDFSPIYNLINNPNVIFTELCITNCNLSDINLNFISEIIKKNTITKLNLSYNKIENIDIITDTLKNNTSIKYINLDHNNINKIDLLCEVLKNNTSILGLKIDNNKIENNIKIAELIKENKSIKRLSINNNHFTNINCIGDALKYNSNILYLDIFDCLTELESVKCFLNSLQFNHTIRNINVCNINTSNFDILEPLQYNSSIRDLIFTGWFSNCKHRKYISSEILAKIISNKKLTELDLYTCKLRGNLYPLVNVLIEQDNVKRLCLREVNSDITELSNYLSQTKNLKELDISRNYISNIRLFTEAIKCNKSIIDLDMGYVAEDYVNIYGYYNTSKEKTPEDVKRLDISYFLQNAILDNKDCKIEKLSISGLVNSNKTIKLLSETIKTNKTITFLSCCGNIWYNQNDKFEKIDLWPLIDAIKSNSSLIWFRINTLNRETDSEQYNLLWKARNFTTNLNREANRK